MRSPETVLYGCTSRNCWGVPCGGKPLTGLSGHHSRRDANLCYGGKMEMRMIYLLSAHSKAVSLLVISHHGLTDYLMNTLMSKTAVSLDIQCHCFPCHCICTDDLPRPMPVCISACTYSSGSPRPVTSQHLIMLTTHLSL